MIAALVRFVVLRTIFGAFFALSSVYCLLAYVPFTYQQLIVNELVGAVRVFAAYHHLLFWVAFVCGAWTLLDDISTRRVRWLVLSFVGTWAAVGVWLFFARPLAGISNGPGALTWAIAWLAPLLWVAVIDLVLRVPQLDWQPEDGSEGGRLFLAALLSGAGVSVLYTGVFLLRFGSDAQVALTSSDRAIAALWGLALHLMAFMASFAAFGLARALASRFRRAALAELAIVCAFGGAALAGVIKSLLLSAVSLGGPPALWVAVTMAGAAAMGIAGAAVRVWPDGEPVRSGLELALRPFVPAARAPRPVRVLWIAALAPLAYATALATAVMDWNYLMQKVGVLLVWTLVFAAVHGALRPGRRLRAATVLMAVPVLLIVSYRSLAATPEVLGRLGLVPSGDLSLVLDRYAGYDVSFRMLHDITRAEPGAAKPDAGAFYALLQRHTNIPRTTAIVPRDLDIVPAIVPTAGRKPHVFVIGIDSLRQDYVSPYNPKVEFTPALAGLARESVVFRHAFTRYGATGLAEPTWFTGALVPHQQYPSPFGPMNSLQKLMMAEGYQPFVTVDSVLRSILAPWPGLVELDRGVPGNQYDVCRTLDELAGHLSSRAPDDDRPVFAFTLAQNVHVSSITREGASVPAGESYPGFYAPYASRVRRLDGCVGTFVEMLKARGWYDDSLIVFTSDHGDSLGEEGRWGHAYTIFPEIVRVPLIVHLPGQWRHFATDPEALAFSVDLAPTLYYLLGQRPTVNHPLFGRPLFTDRLDEQREYLRDDYVVASSYGPVYGLLRDGGRALYVADGTAFRDYDFDMTAGPGGASRRVSDSVRSEAQARIRSTVEEIARFYRLPLER